MHISHVFVGIGLLQYIDSRLTCTNLLAHRFFLKVKGHLLIGKDLLRLGLIGLITFANLLDATNIKPRVNKLVQAEQLVS